ncbi:MAG: hypothetical protein J0I99_00555 [Devosia sp.]|uniref:hypothetical protein n=1 Tax=Devosia sp. TaxID=1871048 RepID=UPI001AC51559|nr:hypothetical protein [Devosia sp.]MBN9314207.1 hypothetical protein [Devosia sp.]
MNILVGCELSGRVRDAFRDAGHNAWSCDILGPDSQEWWIYPAQRHPEFHLVGDVLDVLARGVPGHNLPWDMLIAFPPCTFLSRAGLHWNKTIPGRAEETERALEFVRQLFAFPVRRRCVENPPGAIGSRIRPWTQKVSPHWFGDDASKDTCLWLDNLPELTPTAPLIKDRYANQTESGQHNEQRSPSRGARRSLTRPGLARAMVQHWGRLT